MNEKYFTGDCELDPHTQLITRKPYEIYNDVDWTKASEAFDNLQKQIMDCVMGVASELQKTLAPFIEDYTNSKGQFDPHAAARKRSRDDMNAKRKDLFKRRGGVSRGRGV